MHYDWHHTTTFEETNLVGNIYFSNYFKWQGSCRELFLRDHAADVVQMLYEGRLALVTVGSHCDFFDQLLALEDLVVRMNLTRLDHSRIKMSFSYYRGSPAPENLVARGWQEVACLRRVGGGYEHVPIPESLKSVLAADASSQLWPATTQTSSAGGD